MKRTSHGPNGGSPLISVFGGPWNHWRCSTMMTLRQALLLVVPWAVIPLLLAFLIARWASHRSKWIRVAVRIVGTCLMIGAWYCGILIPSAIRDGDPTAV